MSRAPLTPPLLPPQFFASRGLVTIFSAPNYCGEFDNAGAMMSIDEDLMCSFQILKPAEKRTQFDNRAGGGAGQGQGRPSTPNSSHNPQDRY